MFYQARFAYIQMRMSVGVAVYFHPEINTAAVKGHLSSSFLFLKQLATKKKSVDIYAYNSINA